MIYIKKFLLLIFVISLLFSCSRTPQSQFDKGMSFWSNENNKEAFKWFEKAAKQGYVNAQVNLAIMYLETQRDPVKSYMWLSIARLNKNSSVSKADLLNLEKDMSKTDLKNAKLMAEQCVNSNYQDCD